MGTPRPNLVCQNFHERPTPIRNKLKHALLSKLAKANPSISVTSVHGSYIDRKLQELFQSFPTPTHPPYALMIQNAVMELNEEGGSYKERISGFIETVFEDLPWAHQAILGHHLRMLCENQELVKTECGKYMLPPQSSDLITGREVRMEERETSECEFGGSKDGIVQRREEIDAKTESSDSQMKEEAESIDLQETGQEKLNKKVQHINKEHSQQNAEEHLELEGDQVQVAEAQTEQERQESGATTGQAEQIAVELSGDVLEEGEKSELSREPDEEQAHDVWTCIGHGEPEVSEEKAKNAIVMWELTAKYLDEQQKLKPEMHLLCPIPDVKQIAQILPNVDRPAFDCTSNFAAALQLEQTVRSEYFQVNRLPDKQNEVRLGEIRLNDPPFSENNCPLLLCCSDHQKTPISKQGRPHKKNGNMDMSAEIVVAADAANLEQQATPVHSSCNQMPALSCEGENYSPLCVPDEEQTLDPCVQLQGELGDDSKEPTSAATCDVKQTAWPGFSGLQLPNADTLHYHEPQRRQYKRLGRPPKQKLDSSAVLALPALNLYSSEYQPRKRGRPTKQKLDSEDAGNSGDHKVSASHLETNFQCQLNREDQTLLQHLDCATPDLKNQVLEQTAEVESSQMEMMSAPSVLGLNYNGQEHRQSRQRGRLRKQKPGSEPASHLVMLSYADKEVKNQKKLERRAELMARSSEYRKKLRLRTHSHSNDSDLENPSTS